MKDPNFSETMWIKMMDKAEKEAVDFVQNVGKWITQCRAIEGARITPMFRTAYGGKDYIKDGVRYVLGVCWGSKGAQPSKWFRDVPEEDWQMMKSKTGDWRALIEKYGIGEKLPVKPPVYPPPPFEGASTKLEATHDEYVEIARDFVEPLVKLYDAGQDEIAGKILYNLERIPGPVFTMLFNVLCGEYGPRRIEASIHAPRLLSPKIPERLKAIRDVEVWVPVTWTSTTLPIGTVVDVLDWVADDQRGTAGFIVAVNGKEYIIDTNRDWMQEWSIEESPICPDCKVPMRFVEEREHLSGEKARTYRCPKCLRYLSTPWPMHEASPKLTEDIHRFIHREIDDAWTKIGLAVSILGTEGFDTDEVEQELRQAWEHLQNIRNRLNAEMISPRLNGDISFTVYQDSHPLTVSGKSWAIQDTLADMGYDRDLPADTLEFNLGMESEHFLHKLRQHSGFDSIVIIALPDNPYVESHPEWWEVCDEGRRLKEEFYGEYLGTAMFGKVVGLGERIGISPLLHTWQGKPTTLKFTRAEFETWLKAEGLTKDARPFTGIYRDGKRIGAYFEKTVIDASGRRDIIEVDLYSGKNPNHITEEREGVKFYDGIPIEVLGEPVYTASLPDWTLSYVRHGGRMEEFRRSISRVREEGVKIIKVTDQRIYFEW